MVARNIIKTIVGNELKFLANRVEIKNNLLPLVYLHSKHTRTSVNSDDDDIFHFKMWHSIDPSKHKNYHKKSCAKFTKFPRISKCYLTKHNNNS